jgi:soluble lytic murein transglycosylase-like protein
MRLRMLALWLVALGAGTIVGLADSAGTGEPRGPFEPRATRSATPCPIPAQFRKDFRLAAADTNLPVAMIVAVAKVESRFDANARSEAGAHGLLQVLPSTAAELKLNPYHAGENVLAGARYLRQMLDRFGSTELAFAAYNAGPTAVERAGAAPNEETISYVGRVTAEWRKLVGCS